MIIKVKVKPARKEKKIFNLGNNSFEVSLIERAEKGKANKELVKILAKYLNVSSSNIIIKNPASRDKIIEIK